MDNGIHPWTDQAEHIISGINDPIVLGRLLGAVSRRIYEVAGLEAALNTLNVSGELLKRVEDGKV